MISRLICVCFKILMCVMIVVLELLKKTHRFHFMENIIAQYSTIFIMVFDIYSHCVETNILPINKIIGSFFIYSTILCLCPIQNCNISSHMCIKISYCRCHKFSWIILNHINLWIFCFNNRIEVFSLFLTIQIFNWIYILLNILAALMITFHHYFYLVYHVFFKRIIAHTIVYLLNTSNHIYYNNWNIVLYF